MYRYSITFNCELSLAAAVQHELTLRLFPAWQEYDMWYNGQLLTVSQGGAEDAAIFVIQFDCDMPTLPVDMQKDPHLQRLQVRCGTSLLCYPIMMQYLDR